MSVLGRGFGGTFGVDGPPLLTRPQRNCDPASLVIYRVRAIDEGGFPKLSNYRFSWSYGQKASNVLISSCDTKLWINEAKKL